jgi:Flp pilus assembly protein TadG
MRRATLQLWKSESGSVAPIVAISLFALIGAAGIGFDYSRLVAMHTELQDAADHAALAAAAQLDGKSNARSRATSAAQSLVTNLALFANDGANRNVSVTGGNVLFYQDKAKTTLSTSDANAYFVQVTVDTKQARYALTPVVAAFTSPSINAKAFAGVASGICKVPPVMICNPAETATNTDYLADFSVATGTGLKLVTGNASAPGNFGWLDTNFDNGAPSLAESLGYNTPPGDCAPLNSVSTKPGMTASVLSAFNTRFDIFANGNLTCPSQGNGTCSPSANTRKDLVCKSNNGTNCSNDTWSESANPYRPTTVGGLPIDGSGDPDIMGYPRDECHAVPAGTTGACGITGDGVWDRDAYFRVNYGYSTTNPWTSGTGLPSNVTRYAVYQWEMTHQSIVVGGSSHGIGVAQPLTGNDTGFGVPATGRPGLTPGTSTPDRRRISVAVLNCYALSVNGKTTQIPVAKWLDMFLVEPPYKRVGGSGKDKATYTDDKEVYVEVIGTTTNGSAGGTAGQVVRKDVPYLIE